MSYATIRGPKAKKSKYKSYLDKEESLARIEQILYPSIDILLGPLKVGDTYLRNRSSAHDLLGLEVGIKRSGKSSLLNWKIQGYIDRYGEDLVSIYVGHSIEDILGEFNEDTGKFHGGIIDGKPIQIIVIEDALTLLGKNIPPSTIKKFNQIFENARHQIKYRDEYNNKRGMIVFLLNIQDFYKLHIDARRAWGFIIYKSLVKNQTNLNEFRKQCPKKALEVLEDITERIAMHDPDNSFKNKNIVNFGYGKWGMFKSEWIAKDYTEKDGPWWVTPFTGIERNRSIDQQSDQNEIEVDEEGQGIDQDIDQAIEVIDKPRKSLPKRKYTSRQLTELLKGKIEYKQTKVTPLPMNILEAAFDEMKNNPQPKGPKSKYDPDVHWDTAYRWYVKAERVDYIAGEILGKSTSVITNSYEDSGHIQIVIEEQIGYAFEPVMADMWNHDHDWVYVTGWKRSDLIERSVINQELGIGLHGEVKVRTKNETPQLDWMSIEMKEHMLRGGSAILYKIVLLRRQGRLNHKIYEYKINYQE